MDSFHIYSLISAAALKQKSVLDLREDIPGYTRSRLFLVTRLFFLKELAM